MRVRVTMVVDVDLEAWMREYGVEDEAEAREQVRGDLRDWAPTILEAPKWQGLATLVRAETNTR